jgi:hypothetical protein
MLEELANGKLDTDRRHSRTGPAEYNWSRQFTDVDKDASSKAEEDSVTSTASKAEASSEGRSGKFIDEKTGSPVTPGMLQSTLRYQESHHLSLHVEHGGFFINMPKY